MPHTPGSDTPLRQSLNAAHASLLRIHKALIDHERDRYARAGRPLGTPLQFLQLLLTDPRFAWLRPLSELIVQLDTAASSRTPVDPADAAALLAQARTLLTPAETPAPADTFPHHYQQALQESPEISAAHADWKRTLPPEPPRP